MLGKLIYQLNRWPRALAQKLLALIGILLIELEAAMATLAFTLSAPQSTDTLVPAASEVSTEDGDIIFATSSDLLIPAYSAPAGTISVPAGSTAVTGVGTAFELGTTWEGWQIRVADAATWYTVASVASPTSLVLTTAVPSAIAAAGWHVGPIVGRVRAEATVGGAQTNVGADTLTTLVSSLANVAAVTNVADATGGSDEETIAEAIERAPKAFAHRAVALSDYDYAQAARDMLGGSSRAIARNGYDLALPASGYATVALLSRTWTLASAVSTAERAAVVRDLAGAIQTGITVVDVPAHLQNLGSSIAVAVYRGAQYDALSTRLDIARALNKYLSPSTYEWGRTIYVADLADLTERVKAVDRVVYLESVPAVGTDYQLCAAAITFAASTSATCAPGDAALMTAGKTFLVDIANQQVYLVKVIAGTTLTLDRAWAGTVGAVLAVPHFTSRDTALASWYSLPHVNLSVSQTAPPSSIIVVGVAG